MQRTHFTHVFLSLLVLSANVLHSQTKADRDLIKQARTLYHSPATRPAYIACDSTVDWDAVAAKLELPQTDGYKRGLELVKAMKINFVTRGRQDTTVTVTGDVNVAQQQEQMRQQITRFFMEYWLTADGRMLPGGKDTYELTSTPDGYLITQRTEDQVRTMELNSSFLITKAKVHALGRIKDVEVTPKFTRESDGLLRLSDLLFKESVGQSVELFEYSFDYQQVGGFYVPQHVAMSMPGALTFTHTFANCQVLNKSNAPPPAKPEDFDLQRP